MIEWTLHWEWNEDKSIAYPKVKGGRLLAPNEEIVLIEKSRADKLAGWIEAWIRRPSLERFPITKADLKSALYEYDFERGMNG